VNPETVFTATRNQFSEENNIAFVLLNCHVEIFNSLKIHAHFIEFVVMCSEKCFRLSRMLVKIFCNRPSDGKGIL
jgi:hypothetical protein